MFGRFRPLILTLLVMALSAFTAPEVGDLVELQGFVNARSEAKFRKSDSNKKYVLAEGTKAQVEEVTYFSGTGNYGLRIKLVNADGVSDSETSSLWVYYKVKNPALKLYSLSGNEQERADQLARWEKDPKVKAQQVKNPEDATDAVVVQETPAIVDPVPPTTDGDANIPEVAPTPEPRPDQTLSQQEAEKVVTDLQGLNDAADTIKPDPVCADCQDKPVQYDNCTASNNYIENTIDKLFNQGMVYQALNTSQTHPRLEACVRESMKMSGGSFKNCSNPASPRAANKTCVSQNYVKLTQNGFSLALDCAADYINPQSNREEIRRAIFKSTLSLINLESGFHMNVASGTGAAGIGQFIEGTASSMGGSAHWGKLKSHIDASMNPACQTLQKMNLKATGSGTCDRMSIEKGHPVMGVLYTLAYMKSLRNDIEPTMNRSLRDAGIQLTPEFKEKLLGALATWGHNTGSAGISKPFASLAQTSAGQAALKAGDLDKVLNLLVGEVKSFTIYYEKRRKHSDEHAQKRAEETSGFYSSVQKKMRKLEKTVGRECSM